ncbi:MAG TPA: RNA 2',3'-cyclic phosphodiesterase, partial [Bdellovibrio sp.]
ELKIEDLSAFSSETEARVLWLGVQNKKCLGELKHALDEALLQAEILDHPDQRIFQPHLTIGRLRNPRSVKDMISPFKRKSFGKLQVNEVVLYESRQQGVYQVYTPLLRCPLTGRFELTEEESTAASF